eukprot:maker-scaffold_25-snap-gene-5.55-mRNA-1 protein AED:0.00 eAED:0.00 QI:283/1/1/1/1/1/2/124/550
MLLLHQLKIRKKERSLMRILCLHGFRTNKDIIKFQITTGLGQALKSSKFAHISLTYLNAPFSLNLNSKEAKGVADEKLIELNKNINGEEFFYYWFNSETNNKITTYVGLEDSRNYVLDYIQENGKFDCLLGFSQGGSIVSYLFASLAHNPSLLPVHLRWKYTVYVSSFLPRGNNIPKELFSDNTYLKNYKSIHVLGKKDFMYETSKLLYSFETKNKSDSVLVEHKEDHKFPSIHSSREECKQIVHQLKSWSEEQTKKKYFFAFDFDGVICDSANETGRSGLRLGKRILPEVFNTEEFERLKLTEEELGKVFVNIRPMLETGYEAALLMYKLLLKREEMLDETLEQVSFAARKDLEENYEELDLLREEFISKSGKSLEEIKNIFTQVREDWIIEDLEGWLDLHGFFQPSVDAVKKLLINEKTRERVYVITTKQKQFALRLLESAGLDFPEERVFGLGSGPKHEVMKKLWEENEKGVSERCFFLEDRLNTLLKASNHGNILSDDCGWEFGFANWGYNTKEQELQARQKHFKILNLEGFSQFVDIYLEGLEES